MTFWLPDDDDNPDAESMIRAKWTIEGATTLSEAAAMLRQEARAFELMERAGWQLREPVEDDYGFLVKRQSE